MLPSNPPNAPKLPKQAPGAATKPAKPALGAAIPWAVAGQVFPFLPARKLPDAPFKPSKRSETSTPAPGAATKPAKPSLGAAKLWAVAGQVFPFLPARDCRMLPQAHLQAVPRARQPVLIASATLTNHLRCSGESPTCSTRLGSLSGPDWLHHSTRCCRGPFIGNLFSRGRPSHSRCCGELPPPPATCSDCERPPPATSTDCVTTLLRRSIASAPVNPWAHNLRWDTGWNLSGNQTYPRIYLSAYRSPV